MVVAQSKDKQYCATIQIKNLFKKERIMNLFVKIKEFFSKDWSLVETEELIKEKKDMLRYIESYKQAYQNWDSYLGRLGLKATIRKTEALIAEIDAELAKRKDVKE
jgi:hypothetical protein